ncbi:AAC(3) family N-acetyltransferase [Pseudoalteromonas sp. GB56]
MSLPFSTQELIQAYAQSGVRPGSVVYVTGHVGKLGISLELSKAQLFDLHFQVIQELLSESGTLVVPTHSFSLCNTDTPFSITKTPAETGPFCEFVRQKPEAIRQLHPFSSRAAIGSKARYICDNTSRHSYGQHTPFARMLELDARFVSIGIHPAQIVSLVHQCEADMNVPYRYTKEFLHPIEYPDGVRVEPYYHGVTYRDCDINRDKNQKIFAHFEQQHALQKICVGGGDIWSFSMREFYDATTELMRDDIYAWVNGPPKRRPYQN